MFGLQILNLGPANQDGQFRLSWSQQYTKWKYCVILCACWINITMDKLVCLRVWLIYINHKVKRSFYFMVLTYKSIVFAITSKLKKNVHRTMGGCPIDKVVNRDRSQFTWTPRLLSLERAFYTALRNHNRIVYSDLSSWIALTRYIGMKTIF